MRKTKRCAESMVQTFASRLTVRTCERPRHHEGDCRDKYGNWKKGES